MIACRQPSTVQSQLLPGCHQIHSFSGFMSFCFQVNILSGFPQVKTIVRPWAQTEPVNIYTCVYNTYIYIYTHNIHIIFSYLQTYSLSLVYMYICFDVHIHLQRIEIHTACLHFIIFDTISYNFFFCICLIQSDIQSSHETKVPTAMPSGFQRWTLRGMHGTTTHSVSRLNPQELGKGRWYRQK